MDLAGGGDGLLLRRGYVLCLLLMLMLELELVFERRCGLTWREVRGRQGQRELVKLKLAGRDLLRLLLLLMLLGMLLLRLSLRVLRRHLQCCFMLGGRRRRRAIPRVHTRRSGVRVDKLVVVRE